VAGRFDDGQRIHVGADAQAARTRAFAQRADHAGAAQAAVYLIAPGRELLGDQVAGLVLLECEFRVRVDLATQRHHLGREQLHVVEESGGVHGEFAFMGRRMFRSLTSLA
jgi:hypothetical protein